jgi:prevent-host-death family protein
MITISTMDVRKRVGDILNRVALRGDEFLIERKGKPLAVVLPVAKADAIRRAARLRLGEWLSRPNSLASDVEAMTLANAARRAARTAQRGG